MYRVNHQPTTQCKCQWENQAPSHHTTHSLCDIYLLFLLMSFWATELSGVSPWVSYTLRHFSGFHRWIRCLTRFSSFSIEGGIYPLLVMPDTFIFHFHLTPCDSIWTSSYSRAHIIQHQTQCQIGIMYTHPCNVVFCCTPMQ